MLCDKCGKNEATVIISRNINGDVSEFNLCADCASSASGELSFDNILKNFMNSIMGLNASGADAGIIGGFPESPETSACPTCGLTYDGFKSSGKLGCADCYGAFRKQLVTLFKNVQGSATHYGKVPRRGAQTLIKTREINELKNRLKKLVDDEEFEEAARVRDVIKELTAQ